MQKILLIALGGACGALVRYATGLVCVRFLGDRFAYGTLTVNVVGCLAIGVLLHHSGRAEQWVGHAPHAALTVGLLGALTTFSTFGYETVHYLQTERPALAGVNVAANVVLGLAAVGLGMRVADYFTR